jgi:hypothetical protein
MHCSMFVIVTARELWEEDFIIQNRKVSDNEIKFKWLFRLNALLSGVFGKVSTPRYAMSFKLSFEHLTLGAIC